MISQIPRRMSGEELLLLRILSDDSAAPAIEAELDRRASLGATTRPASTVKPAGEFLTVLPAAA